MIYPVVRELAVDQIPDAVNCRVLRLPPSGYYDWVGRPLTGRDLADAYLLNEIVDVHRASRGTYGAPRVHAELRLGRGIGCGRKRVARLMCEAGLRGVTRRRRRELARLAAQSSMVGPGGAFGSSRFQAPHAPGAFQPAFPPPAPYPGPYDRSLAYGGPSDAVPSYGGHQQQYGVPPAGG